MKENQLFSNERNHLKSENTKNNNHQELNIDSRLQYVLTFLDIVQLYNLFVSQNISFVDMLLLDKEDMVDLHIELYQRNRICNFAILYKKYAKNYSIEEISDFFSFNRHLIFMKLKNGNKKNKVPKDEVVSCTKAHSLLDKNNEKNDFPQKQNNEKKRSNKITLSTSKEKVNDEIIEEQKTNETYPNIHQSILEGYQIKKHLTEGKYQNQNYNTTVIRNNGNKRNNHPDKKTMLSYHAEKNYTNIRQNANNILIKLTKLKEEGEIKKNKYKTLFQKIEKYNSNININGNLIQNKIDTKKEIYFNKMMLRINQASEMKMNFTAFEKLNKIKEFINIKGKQIQRADIQLINRELDVLINSLLNNEATHSPIQSSDLNEGNKGNDVEEVEEEFEEDEYNQD